MDLSTSGPNTYEMMTRLSLSECLRRLQEVVDLPMTPFGWRPVIGRAEPYAGGARLRLRKRIFPRRYTLQTWLIGTLAEHEGRTRLSYRLAPDPAAKLWLVAWCVFFTLIGLGMTADIAQLPAKPDDTTKWMSLAVPVFFILVGIGSYKMGQFLGRNEPRFLAQLMEEVLDASPRADL